MDYSGTAEVRQETKIIKLRDVWLVDSERPAGEIHDLMTLHYSTLLYRTVS